MTQTITRPAFRARHTNGAWGYDEADTFAAALEGFKRKRKSVMFHMTNSGEAGQQDCIVCGHKLADAYPVNVGTSMMTDKVDTWSTWTYSPKHKAVGNGMHYGCSWGNLFNQIFKLADAGRIF